MNMLRKALAAAVVFGLGIAAVAPASAGPIWHPFPKPMPNPMPHPFPHPHGPDWGVAGIGFGIGLGLGVMEAGIEEESCIRYRPVYDDYGNYRGRRAVNVCY